MLPCSSQILISRSQSMGKRRNPAGRIGSAQRGLGLDVQKFAPGCKILPSVSVPPNKLTNPCPQMVRIASTSASESVTYDDGRASRFPPNRLLHRGKNL